MSDDEPGQVVLAVDPEQDPDGAALRLQVLRESAGLVTVDPAGEQVHQLVEQARTGATVLVLTTAGSTSATAVVRAAGDAGVRVTAVPHPSAALTALALSGMATDRFCIEGPLPADPVAAARVLAAVAEEPRTLVYTVARGAGASALQAMSEAFGAARLAVCVASGAPREVRRGELAELAEQLGVGRVEGGAQVELTVVVAGCPAPVAAVVEVADLVAAVRARVAGGERLKDAVAAVAAPAGYPKRDLYDAVTRG